MNARTAALQELLALVEEHESPDVVVVVRRRVRELLLDGRDAGTMSSSSVDHVRDASAPVSDKATPSPAGEFLVRKFEEAVDGPRTSEAIPIRRWDDPSHVSECPCCAAWTADRDAWRDRARSAEAGMHLAAESIRAAEPVSAEATPHIDVERAVQAWLDDPENRRPFGFTFPVLVALAKHVLALPRRERAIPKPDAWATDGDKPLPEDRAISDAHPLTTGRHDLYAEAMRLVGARRSKGGLVELVNWLLHSRDRLMTALNTAESNELRALQKSDEIVASICAHVENEMGDVYEARARARGIQEHAEGKCKRKACASPSSGSGENE